jgi:hypothetical protein
MASNLYEVVRALVDVNLLIIIGECIAALVLWLEKPNFLLTGSGGADLTAQVAVLITYLVGLAARAIVPIAGCGIATKTQNRVIIYITVFIGVLASFMNIIVLGIVIGSCKSYGACFAGSVPSSTVVSSMWAILALTLAATVILIIALVLAFFPSISGGSIDYPPQGYMFAGGTYTGLDSHSGFTTASFVFTIISGLVTIAIAICALVILNAHPVLTTLFNPATGSTQLAFWLMGILFSGILPWMGWMCSLELMYIRAVLVFLATAGIVISTVIQSIVLGNCSKYNVCGGAFPHNTAQAFVALSVFVYLQLVLLVLMSILVAMELYYLYQPYKSMFVPLPPADAKYLSDLNATMRENAVREQLGARTVANKQL